MPGSVDPSSRTDQQCPHCGLWFTPQGVTNHKRNCQLKDLEARVQPLEESAEAAGALGGESDVEDDLDDGATPEDVDDKTTLVESDEEVTPPEPESTVEGDGDQDVATTDGGNPAFDAPDPVEVERQDVDEDDGDQADDTVACPHCGDAIDNWDDLEPGKTYKCGNCGGAFDR